MILTRKSVRVEKVEISKNESEIVQVEVKNGNGKAMNDMCRSVCTTTDECMDQK